MLRHTCIWYLHNLPTGYFLPHSSFQLCGGSEFTLAPPHAKPLPSSNWQPAAQALDLLHPAVLLPKQH